MNVWKKLASQSLNKNFFSFSSRERKKKNHGRFGGKKMLILSIYLSIYGYSF